MDDRIEVSQGPRVSENQLRQPRAVQPTVRLEYLSREARHDRGQRRLAGFDNVPGHLVGIDNEGTEFLQPGGHRGLARADPTSESHTQHVAKVVRHRRQVRSILGGKWATIAR